MSRDRLLDLVLLLLGLALAGAVLNALIAPSMLRWVLVAGWTVAIALVVRQEYHT